MKLKHLFLVHAVIATCFGLSLLLVPMEFYALYGAKLDLVGVTAARLWGAAILGYVVLAWLCRNGGDSEARRSIVLAFFLMFTIGFVASVVNQFTVAHLRQLGQLLYSTCYLRWGTPISNSSSRMLDRARARVAFCFRRANASREFVR